MAYVGGEPLAHGRHVLRSGEDHVAVYTKLRRKDQLNVLGDYRITAPVRFVGQVGATLIGQSEMASLLRRPTCLVWARKRPRRTGGS